MALIGYDAVGHIAHANPQFVERQPPKEEISSIREKGEGRLDANAIIDRLRQVFGASNDTALSKALGLGTSAPNNWRSRNAPPYAICAQVSEDRDVSLDWLIFGTGDMSRAAELAKTAAAKPRSETAQRIIQFVEIWDTTRQPEETIWLEQQLRRSVPEYGEWLATDARQVT